jgi:Peptide N-acetyl-beta-D-glucosaminyl asparaginase amidase A
MKFQKKLRFILLSFMLLLVLFFVGGTQTVLGQSPQQFEHTDNPIDIDPPIQLPPTHPIVRTILHNQTFGNAPPPATTAVTLPAGRWGKVILTITGTQQGQQYDRLLLMWAGNTQIFAGVTPEPTAAGISWKVQKDVTVYLPLLTGTQTITTQLANYVTSVYTGIPSISSELDFYPGQFTPTSATDTWELQPPDTIVPITAQPNMTTVNTGQSLTSDVTLPHDITKAYLDLYAIGQNTDEFWWANNPAFREVEVSIDGKPAGVVWPFPYIYTGGVNPLLWRPLTAIHTLNLPAYRLDLTPFAGLLGGKHTVSIQVENNQNYWLLAGSLFLYENHGRATTGSITSDTLTFPTQAPPTTTGILGDTSNPLLNEEATSSYKIQGTIQSSNGSWIASVDSSLHTSNDQTNVNPGYWQMVHSLQDVTTNETLADAYGQPISQRQSDDSYTLDATSAYVQPSNNATAFFLPADVTQSLSEVHSTSGSAFQRPYHSSLYETIQGYAAIQSGTDTHISNGSSTAYANLEDSSGRNYHELLESRGGLVTLQQITGR